MERVYETPLVGANDSYVIERRIGGGGFGDAYLAHSERNGQTCVCKIFSLWKQQPHERKNLKRRFEFEYEAMNRLRSPHIVEVLDFGHYEQKLSQGAVNEDLFIAMEYCEGGSLDQHIQNLDPPAAHRFAVHMLNGLHVAHEESIYHRDIKPHNIFLKDNIAKVADFGIARDNKNKLTKVIKGKLEQVLYTLQYAPPEQIDGEPQVTVAHDIYAFGVTLYQLLTGGRFPHTDSNMERAKKSGHWDKGSLAQIPDQKKWVNIIEKCIAPDRNDRYPSVAQILDDLGEVPQENRFDSSQYASSATWALVVMDGEEAGRKYDLTSFNKRLLKLGYGQPNDIDIHEPDITQYVSSKQATIELYDRGEEQEWCLKDGQWQAHERQFYQPKNTTLVNGEPIRKPTGHILKRKEVITVGDVTLKVVGPSPPPSQKS